MGRRPGVDRGTRPAPGAGQPIRRATAPSGHGQRDGDSIVTDDITVDVHLDADYVAETLRSDVLAGLLATPKSLPPKWFYDARGSELFERITELPEYYQTRTELGILHSIADGLISDLGTNELVELGSGSSTKTRVLLDAMERAHTLRRYLPFDV